MALFDRKPPKQLDSYDDVLLTPGPTDTKSTIIQDGEPLPPTLSEAMETVKTTDASTDIGEVDVKKRLSVLSRKIRTAKKNAVMSILTIGRALEEARDLLSIHGSGGYGKWLLGVGISRASAHRCIQAHAVFGDRLSERQSTFIESQAIFLLSAKTAPPAAVTDAVQILSEGESITASTARLLVGQHQPAKKANSRPPPVIIKLPEGTIALRPKLASTSLKQMLTSALRELVEAKRAA